LINALRYLNAQRQAWRSSPSDYQLLFKGGFSALCGFLGNDEIESSAYRRIGPRPFKLDILRI
jgi:hypothetical protein